MKFPTISYLPDVDPTETGVITDGNAFVPTLRGLKAAPSAVATTLEALPAACAGAASVLKLDNTQRFLAATSVRILEATSPTDFTDRSEGGADYTTVLGRWRFAQSGNVTLAASKQNLLQESATDDFATVADSIKADIVETVGLFVMCFNTDDTDGVALSLGDRPNSWWCSAVADHTDWTPSLTTQCATGEFVSVPGRVTAGKRFGDQIVAYKERGLYLGTYRGPPEIWIWQEIPSDTGTWCQESVVNIGTPEQPKHFFVGRDNFYVFDGSRPQPVGDGIKQTFFQSLNTAEADKICTLLDRKNSLVYVFYPTGSSTTLDACVVWDYQSRRWGVDNRSIEFAVEYVNAALTYGDLGTYYATYADITGGPYGELFTSEANGTPAIFSTSHAVQTLTGTPTDSYLVTGDYGDDVNNVFLKRVKPTFTTKPTSAVLTCYHRGSLGDALSLGPSSSMSDSRFDVRISNRWHRLKLEMVGDWEMNKIDAQYSEAGKE